VAWDNPIQRFTCITLNGDLYRNDGILTGGANNFKPILGEIKKLLSAEKEIVTLRNQSESNAQNIQRV